jgi:hypothetical protein
MKQHRIAGLSYHPFPKEDWPADEFAIAVCSWRVVK